MHLQHISFLNRSIDRSSNAKSRDIHCVGEWWVDIDLLDVLATPATAAATAAAATMAALFNYTKSADERDMEGKYAESKAP